MHDVTDQDCFLSPTRDRLRPHDLVIRDPSCCTKVKEKGAQSSTSMRRISSPPSRCLYSRRMPLLLCMAEQSHAEPKQTVLLSAAELARRLLDQAQASANRWPMPQADASRSLTLEQAKAIIIDVVRIPAEALWRCGPRRSKRQPLPS